MKPSIDIKVMIAKENRATIEDAFKQLEQILTTEGTVTDHSYYLMHKPRFKRMVNTVTANITPGGKILDIGSHFLHCSLVFKFLGYEVYSMDVSAFQEISFVKNRIERYGLKALVNDNLEIPAILNGYHDFFDGVIFSETLEHITFNPINFWKTIHEVVKIDGIVYISTPNSLNLFNVLNSIRRIIFLKGIGISVIGIFSSVTYGHHWKEYSLGEIKQYFSYLSKDFQVKIIMYGYRKYPKNGVKNFIYFIIRSLGNWSKIFADEMEVIIRINRKTEWLTSAPSYQ
jgi:2-polyprenyl-3-methyl-5-hydroxy-6-metoxy-1,4-benzoquinol methylase